MWEKINMKTKNPITAIISLGVFILIVSLDMMGCSQDSPLQPSVIKYPLRENKIFQYDATNQVYGEGEISLENGSIFKIRKGALIPPNRHKKGKGVNIIVDVSINETNNVETYTFGPSGCQFQPCLEAVFNYSSFGTNQVNVYYIEDDGSWTELTSTRIDTVKKLIYCNISHFSRYALAHAE